jgi:hypothetical protein
MKLTKLVVRNYRGIESREDVIGEHGAIASGANGKGKTSILRAIRAALAGNDIGPDAIRIGADSAEILVNVDDVSVRRAISRRGSTLTVERDGFAARKPQTFLSELLGLAPLDPLDLLLLKAKDRRARILEALPCTVTREQLASWAPDLPRSFDLDGHGLDVVERARKLYYDRRALANATSKKSGEAAHAAIDAIGGAERVSELAAATPNVPAAQQAVESARRHQQRLDVRAEEARAASERTEATRQRALGLRERAATERETASNTSVTDADIEAARADLVTKEAEVDRLTGLLQEAESARRHSDKYHDDLIEQRDASARHAQQAVDLDRQASDLEASVAAGIAVPSAEEIASASDAVTQAAVALAAAQGSAKLAREAKLAKELLETAAADAAEAARLDAAVKRLSNDAPRELFATSETIRGLSLEGDDVLLDGVSLDGLCGAEAMRFCVEVARRANAKAKFLVVDGLERLDPEQSDAFVKDATRDGWQLIATRVDRGDLVLHQIEVSDEEAEAAQ